MKNIEIRPLLNGWMVRVGCQELAYIDAEKLCCDLRDYLKNPEATTTRILKNEAVNQKWTVGNSLAQATPPAQRSVADVQTGDNERGSSPVRERPC